MATISDKGRNWRRCQESSDFKRHILSDYPAVGDFCTGKLNESGNSAIIESLLPRKVLLSVKQPENQQEQVVAANIDIVLLCMALNNDFNLRRLERYIPLGDSGAMPVIVLDKIGSMR